MKVIVDVCVVPLGVGSSVSDYVVECSRIFRDADLSTKLHAYGTNVEGEWDEVFAAIRRCHEVLHDRGAPRISTSVKVGTRTDKEQTIADKISSVESKL